MSRKINFLNVRKHLEYVIFTVDSLLEDNDKHKNGLHLPPLYIDNLKELRYFSKLILQKHARKKTRKDIYVERN